MLEEDKQIIISISREFGSGGKEIAELLADHYQIPVYEKNILEETDAARANLDGEDLYVTRSEPRILSKSRMVRGLTNKNEEVLALMEFDFLKEQADQGKSFVVLGHCAEEVLKGNPNLTTFFISADPRFKIPRIMKEHGLNEVEAAKMMKKHNKKRKSYHNYYCSHSWGDSRYYEMCLRSDKLGTVRTAALMSSYLDAKLEGPELPLLAEGALFEEE